MFDKLWICMEQQLRYDHIYTGALLWGVAVSLFMSIRPLNLGCLMFASITLKVCKGGVHKILTSDQMLSHM